MSYDPKLCYILSKRDLSASGRILPMDKLKCHHILPSVLSKQQIERAQLIIVKESSSKRATLKDKFAVEGPIAAEL